MERLPPCLYVVVGPNGSGKSSISRQYGIPMLANGLMVNPDLIAAGIGGKDYDERNRIAAEVAEAYREHYLLNHLTFGFETVGSTDGKLDFIRRVKEEGYHVVVLFVTTVDPAINLERVTARVRKGGHDVPAVKIECRYWRTMRRLPEYISIADEFYAIDNSGDHPVIVFTKSDGKEMILADPGAVAWVDVLIAPAGCHSIRVLPNPDHPVYCTVDSEGYSERMRRSLDDDSLRWGPALIPQDLPERTWSPGSINCSSLSLRGI